MESQGEINVNIRDFQKFKRFLLIPEFQHLLQNFDKKSLVFADSFC